MPAECHAHQWHTGCTPAAHHFINSQSTQEWTGRTYWADVWVSGRCCVGHGGWWRTVRTYWADVGRCCVGHGVGHEGWWRTVRTYWADVGRCCVGHGGWWRTVRTYWADMLVRVTGAVSDIVADSPEVLGGLRSSRCRTRVRPLMGPARRCPPQWPTCWCRADAASGNSQTLVTSDGQVSDTRSQSSVGHPCPVRLPCRTPAKWGAGPDRVSDSPGALPARLAGTADTCPPGSSTCPCPLSGPALICGFTSPPAKS
jgi:hypothetical protein